MNPKQLLLSLCVACVACCGPFTVVLAFFGVPDRAPPPRKAVDPGDGGSPPSDAIVLFDGKDLSQWRGPSGEPRWKVEDGAVTVAPGTGDLTTRASFGDVQLHIEWRIPAAVKGEGEGRGNSGIKLHEAYEIQILDSFGRVDGPLTQAGAVYKQWAPLVNACRKPGEWQSYDVVFRSPRFAADGSLSKRGTFTVLHNGVLIHDKVQILGRTNSTRPVKPELKQPFFLQDHGSAVSFRNIWVRELDPEPEPDAEAKR
jgi:hypothetical protein